MDRSSTRWPRRFSAPGADRLLASARNADLRILALLATYNERRFIAGCLEHLRRHGVETYLIDNSSTDGTVEIAERYLGDGLVGIETFPRGEIYEWRALLARKEQLARELESDWFIHLDADELRLPPPGVSTLAEAIAEVDRVGFNAVNFTECTFIPTREDPDHDHPDFVRTLRTYYPFAPTYPHQMKAWKSTDAVELTWSAGHKVRFPGLRMHPQSFPMKHYLFLSLAHAAEKYEQRSYDPRELESGWHRWRASFRASAITLPSRSELRVTQSDSDLDHSEPRKRHYVDKL